MISIFHMLLTKTTTLLALSAIQTDKNQQAQKKNQFFCCSSYKIIDRNNLELCISLTDTLTHVGRNTHTQTEIHTCTRGTACMHTAPPMKAPSKRSSRHNGVFKYAGNFMPGWKRSFEGIRWGTPNLPLNWACTSSSERESMEREHGEREGWREGRKRKIKIEGTRWEVGREMDGEKEGERAGERAATRCFGLVPAPCAQLLFG